MGFKVVRIAIFCSGKELLTECCSEPLEHTSVLFHTLVYYFRAQSDLLNVHPVASLSCFKPYPHSWLYTAPQIVSFVP